MNSKRTLRSILLNLLCSERLLTLRRRVSEIWRRLRGRKHRVSVFLELDDPYSYLLCHYLRELDDHYDIELRLYLTEAIVNGFRPAPELHPEYALNDSRHLARELGVPFLDRGRSPPVEHRRALLAALAAREDSKDFGNELVAAITAYWRGDSAAVASRAEELAVGKTADAMLKRNRRLLKKLGHYNTAMLHYGGEWYWGVDRLHYLVERLDDLGAAVEPGLAPRIASIRQVMRVDLPVRPPTTAKDLPPLELFFSFRSPYSYLALERVRNIAAAFGVELVLRPVLPMVLRGMKLPFAKLKYIAFDAAREARTRNIAFGRFCDPLGEGIERCMAAFSYAANQNKALEFAINASRAIWVKGIDVATDEGLREVASETGLIWPDVAAVLQQDAWRGIAATNNEAMMASGVWGVPSLRIGDWISWGQDRDWLAARHLEELCDSGEGILV